MMAVFTDARRVYAHFHHDVDEDDYVVSNNEKKDICYYVRKGGKNLKSTFTKTFLCVAMRFKITGSLNV